MTRYAIGVGSNLGDRRQRLVDAVAELSDLLGPPLVSPLYETEPVGGPDQDPFLNAVVSVESALPALDVLAICQTIEEAQGRVREERWGPRTLDLDIVASDGPPHADDRLEIPHPRATEREFVLRPLAEVWPEAPVGEGLTAQQALDAVGDQGVDLLSSEWIPPVSSAKANALLAGQFALFVAVAVALAYQGSLPTGDAGLPVVVGVVMAMVGGALALVSSRRLGRAMTASPIPRPEGELVVTGPYRFARHPIYGGLCLFLMGASLALDSPVGLVIAAALVPYFLLKARYEERQLRMQYAGYLEYQRNVRRWLFPFVA